ncbi:unnamed protein product [Gordionus sp. m RMFG-2023]|uniref:UBX domain-containing protein 1-A-like isoform X2 n=1 Tax=Gordionus sp. m RMFG-2023 TaxID=3053472 RepID=UPI0030E100C1
MAEETTSTDLLMEMGFPLQKIFQAILTTGSQDIGQLITWMEENEVFENANDSLQTTLPSKSTDQKSVDSFDPSKSAGQQTLDSLISQKVEDDKLENNKKSNTFKCKICQKLFKNDEIAAIHASKTGHADFEESNEELKPLTEEEKKLKVEELQKTLEKRRLEKEKEEEEESRKREQQRRKQGKEFLTIKEKIREQELLKMADERKREKMEDQMAKQRIKDLIERDKMDRMKKFNYIESDQVNPIDSLNNCPSTNSYNHESVKENQQITENDDIVFRGNGLDKKEYDKCDLQIRMIDGKILKHSFGAKEELAAVRLFVLMNSTHNFDDTAQSPLPVSLMTPFPKRVFSEGDMSKPLSELGLVPKAVLTVTRQKA